MTTTEQKPAAGEKASRADKGKPKPRSPSYPGVNLEEALRLAGLVWKADGRNEAHEDNILAHWKYKPKSGLGLVALAALKSFGLLEVNKANSRLKLSALAISILLDEREDGTEKAKAIQVAALNPAMHKAMWEEYGAKLPSEGTVRYYLKGTKKFTEAGANQLIAEYRATMAFAYPATSGILVHEKSDKLEGGTRGGAGVNVGDLTPGPPSKLPPGKGANPAMVQATFPVSGGEVVIQWPAQIKEESSEDLKDWLEVMVRRVLRAVSEAEGVD